MTNQTLAARRQEAAERLAALQDQLHQANLSSAPEAEIADLRRRVSEALDRRIKLDREATA